MTEKKADQKKTARVHQRNAGRASRKVAVSSPAVPETRKIVFAFHELDTGGSWKLKDLTKSHAPHLFQKLTEVCNLTVDQAFQNNWLCTINVEKFNNKAAKTRLKNQYEGLDSLTELRIRKSGDLRLHGRLEGNVFSVIWWDPKHSVHPDGGKNVR